MSLHWDCKKCYINQLCLIGINTVSCWCRIFGTHLHLLIFDQAILSPLTCPRQNISSVKKKQRVPVSVYYVNILSFKTTCGKQMQEIFTREHHGCSYSMWGQKLEKTCCYTEHLLKQYILQNNFLYISDPPLNVLNWISFRPYFTKNWIFPKIWATHFSCFCWQPMEIVSKHQNYLKTSIQKISKASCGTIQAFFIVS